MKATGIVRRVDDLGRVVIPKELRRTMEIKEGDPLEIFVQGESVVLRKYDPDGRCRLCGSDNQVRKLVTGQQICNNCIEHVSRLRR